MSEFDLVEYKQHRELENPHVLEAYDLQCEIDRLQSELNSKQEKYTQILNSLTAEGIKGQYHNITEMRPYRYVNVEWVEKNLPEIYDETVTLSDKDIVEMMLHACSRKELLNRLQNINPKQFEALRKINVTDFDKACGGKTRSKKYEGTAIGTLYKAGSKTRIIYIGGNMPQLKRPASDKLAAYGVD